jgi:hypothetical protein
VTAFSFSITFCQKWRKFATKKRNHRSEPVSAGSGYLAGSGAGSRSGFSGTITGGQERRPLQDAEPDPDRTGSRYGFWSGFQVPSPELFKHRKIQSGPVPGTMIGGRENCKSQTGPVLGLVLDHPHCGRKWNRIWKCGLFSQPTTHVMINLTQVDLIS